MTRPIEEVREILRNWVAYGPHFDDDGVLLGYWGTPLDVDSMTDEQVWRIAERVAAGE